jgi:hypothetical protein
MTGSEGEWNNFIHSETNHNWLLTVNFATDLASEKIEEERGM